MVSLRDPAGRWPLFWAKWLMRRPQRWQGFGPKGVPMFSGRISMIFPETSHQLKEMWDIWLWRFRPGEMKPKYQNQTSKEDKEFSPWRKSAAPLLPGIRQGQGCWKDGKEQRYDWHGTSSTDQSAINGLGLTSKATIFRAHPHPGHPVTCCKKSANQLNQPSKLLIYCLYIYYIV